MYRARAGSVPAIGDPDVSRSLKKLLWERRRTLAGGRRPRREAHYTNAP